MSGDGEVRAAADRLDRPLELVAGERRQLTALLADEVMVVDVGVDPLVTGGIAADLHPLHQMELLELLERAVDAGAADGLEPAVDLERGHRAGFATQQLDHPAARAAAAVARIAQSLYRQLRPGHGG